MINTNKLGIRKAHLGSKVLAQNKLFHKIWLNGMANGFIFLADVIFLEKL